MIARLGSPDELGTYALALAICSPVFLFFEGKLREVQATDVRGSLHFSDYIVVRLWSVSIAFVVTVALAAAVPSMRASSAVVVAVGWTKAVESVGDILYGRMQVSERMDLIARSRIAKGLVGILVGGAVLASTASLSWMMIGVGTGWMIVVLVVDIPYLARLHEGSARAMVAWLRSNTSFERSRRLLKEMLPLGAVSALVSLRENLPRYILLRTHGVSVVGFFAAAMTLPEAGKRIVDPLGQALLPRLATHLHEGRSEFLRLLGRSILAVGLLALAGLVLALVAGEQLLRALYGPEYGAYLSVLVIGVVATGVNFVASILNIAMLATRRFLVQLPAAVIAAMAVLLAGVVSIPAHGAVGGAIALGVGMATWALTLGVALWLTLRSEPAIQSGRGLSDRHSVG
ncbi:MAG: lipopolysaccharide biosynthesis protein [Dehalococcoidia bacterium]